MAEKIIIAEVDIDLDKAVKNIQDLKKATAEAKQTSDELKKTAGETSGEFIKANAAYKATAAELRTQENLYIKVTSALSDNAGTLQKVEAQNAQLREERKKLRIEDENYDSELKRINDTLDLNTKFIKSNSDSQKQQTLNIGNYEEAVKPVKVQLREITLLMQQMAAAGKDDGEEFTALAQKAGKLKDAMNATNDQIKVFATGDKMEQTLTMAKGSFDALSGAAQTYEGTMQALGVENESVQRGIQKMVALQSIQNGVTQIYTALQKESAFMLTVNTVKTNVMSAAQAIYTAAVGTSTGALKAFKIAMLATGIGAAIVAIGLLIANWDRLSGAINSSAKAQEDYNNASQRLELTNTIINKQIDSRIEKLKVKGATDEEIAKTELARQQAIINNAEKQKKLDEQELARLKEKDANGQSKWNKELASEIYLQQVKVDNSKKNIQNLKEEYNTSIVILTENVQKRNAEEEKARKEKSAKDKEEQAKRNKDYLDAENDKWNEENARQQEAFSLELEEKKRLADESIKILSAELEIWKINNAEKISGAKQITTELVKEEENRLLLEESKEVELLQKRYANGEMLQEEFELAKLQITDKSLKSQQELQDLFQKQEDDNRKAALTANAENEYALAEGNIFRQLDLQKQANDLKLKEELRLAEKTGADKSKIEAKYRKAELALEKAKTNAKLALAAGFAGNLATIFGEGTKIGKAAAVVQTTISTYQAATGAYAAMASIPYVGPALGIAAAAAAVASGIANVKKILAVKTDVSSASASVDSSSASTPSATSSLVSANANIGAGIVSRDTVTNNQSQQQTQTVLVVDDVTAKQMGNTNKIKTANI